MVRIVILLTGLLISTGRLHAQNTLDWSSITQRIDGKPYAGKKFRLDATVKVERVDSTAEAEIWVRVDRHDKKRGFFYNMMDKPIRSREWTTYSISGTIDRKAEYFNFGGLFARKGKFYFDDFKLFIENNGAFEQVSLQDGGFENINGLDTAWKFVQNRNAVVLDVTTEQFFSGKQSLKVDGSRFNRKGTYGINDSLGKYVFVNGAKLYYETYGQGEPLILLHGNSQSIKDFRFQIPAFAQQYKIIAIDTRGHGRSSEDGAKYTYELFAKDVIDLMDSLSIDSANIVGWSDGGNTGLIMAMKYPGRVKKLVAMGAVIFMDKTVVDKRIPRLLENELSQLKKDTTHWGRNRSRLIKLMLTEPGYTFSDLAAIRCPVLVMAGENDVVKEQHTRSIAQHITGSSLHIAKKQTHDYPQENPVGFNKTVLDFLK